MMKRILEGFPPSHAVYTSGSNTGKVAAQSVSAMREFFDLLDQYGDATMGISPGSLSDPRVKRSEDIFCMWHRHANRAYRLYAADIIREDRMREQVALSREKMAKERTPIWFWLPEDDALNMVQD